MDGSKFQIPEADELRVFSAEETRKRLGGISESYYYELRSKGWLRHSRLTEGGKVVHTPKQIRDYIAYLDGAGEVKVAVDEFTERRNRKLLEQDRPSAAVAGGADAVRRGGGRRGAGGIG